MFAPGVPADSMGSVTSITDNLALRKHCQLLCSEKLGHRPSRMVQCILLPRHFGTHQSTLSGELLDRKVHLRNVHSSQLPQWIYILLGFFLSEPILI
ncbi:hypothetical protein EXN66_Car015839 [Channa argus]|uniref:Uncharacterized protein n=1 Tax=Channa argus TaxID=215402 RepID=A0A6G1QC82_CHAAH|nr:hypothetical protein EXN66_Car015839 [Channa argus]